MNHTFFINGPDCRGGLAFNVLIFDLQERKRELTALLFDSKREVKRPTP